MAFNHILARPKGRKRQKAKVRWPVGRLEELRSVSKVFLVGVLAEGAAIAGKVRGWGSMIDN
jgi:hypothetical protein